MKIIFFGTPQFSADVFRYLSQNGVQIAAVISKPDKAQGRSLKLIPTPLKVAAEEFNVPVHQPEKVSAPEFSGTLEAYEADLFVVVAYGEILKQHVLDMPKIASINLHTSLLPKYRGAAPIQRAIIEGEKESGVTIMHMARKMDAGDIIKVKKVAIGPDETFGELQQNLLSVGSQLILETILDFQKGIEKRTVQEESKATLAPKIELEDCEIDWKKPAEEIHNLVRGVNPYPGAWCKVLVRGEEKNLKIWRTTVVKDKQGAPGEILSFGKQGMVIACGKEAVKPLEVQLEGKRRMNADEFARGFSADALIFTKGTA